LFFQLKSPGRKVVAEKSFAASMVIELRKKYLSVPDIKVILDGKGVAISEKDIFHIIKREGFSRLPRKTNNQRQKLLEVNTILPKKSVEINYKASDIFTSNSVG